MRGFRRRHMDVRGVRIYKDGMEYKTGSAR